MSRGIVRVEIHEDLKKVLEDLRKAVASDMKREYGLDEIIVPRTLSSQILAAKHRGAKSMNIRINKTGPNKGFLELI